ncbi:MAG: DUF2795 domain-containing protein [Armatimonadota bacterium]|nr:DUF2795 domain-containing protein [Armatimonadota bacterium]
MPLYCSMEILNGLAGAAFPATKQELLEYAKQHDAPEAAVVVLNQLEDAIFQDVGDVCHNAGIVCSIETAEALAEADFPATKTELIKAAMSHKAPEHVIFALKALPEGLPFGSLEDVCMEIM